MLGAVVVHLQRERGARLDHDALHLKALAALDAVVGAPGTVHLAMHETLLAARGLERGHELADRLGAFLLRHEYCVRSLDHHHVVHADTGDHAVLREDERVARIGEMHVAARRVAGGILLFDRPERIPRADV